MSAWFPLEYLLTNVMSSANPIEGFIRLHCITVSFRKWRRKEVVGIVVS